MSYVPRLHAVKPKPRSLTTAQRAEIDLSASVPGWGSDLDPARRPGVPRDKAPDIGIESLYPDIEPQRGRSRIHRSTEHGRMPAVFGTSCPPRGLSGRVRDSAYRASEGRLRRWVGLLVADRIDMVESLVRDVARGRPPNLVREMGLRTEWRHNPEGVLRKALVAGFVATTAVVLVSRMRARSRSGDVRRR
jgi:hypothetical protein